MSQLNVVFSSTYLTFNYKCSKWQPVYNSQICIYIFWRAAWEGWDQVQQLRRSVPHTPHDYGLPLLLTVSLRPFYLSWEFQLLFYTLVYIHPRANASIAAQVIADVTHRLDSICPEAPKFLMGDFNHCILNKTLRSYEQYITCSTTQRNTTIDLCYGSVIGAYRSMAMPALGASYHNSVYLMPVYKNAFRRLEHEEKTIKLWADDSILLSRF